MRIGTILGFAAVVIWALAERKYRVSLEAALKEQAKCTEPPSVEKRDHPRLNSQVFRVPGANVRLLETAIGRFIICKMKGYYDDTAIFICFPPGFSLSQEIADNFRRETQGCFIMEPAPGNSNGGSDAADAIITTGRDFGAYQRGEQGYFKCSPAPDLDAITTVLARILAHPVGVAR